MLRKISRGYQITLPPWFRERFHLKIGDRDDQEIDLIWFQSTPG